MTAKTQALAIAFGVGVAAAALILAVGGRYGIFRDELYYWICARHLAWGYVDHPPFSILLLHFVGDHLWQIKLPAAVAFGVTVFLMGRQAFTMGATVWGTALTTVLTALCPLLAAVAGMFSMNVLEIAFWSVATTITARLLVDPTPSLWIALGVVVGLGLLNKYSMLLFVAGLFLRTCRDAGASTTAFTLAVAGEYRRGRDLRPSHRMGRGSRVADTRVYEERHDREDGSRGRHRLRWRADP
jgi:hypothetical protein